MGCDRCDGDVGVGSGSLMARRWLDVRGSEWVPLRWGGETVEFGVMDGMIGMGRTNDDYTSIIRRYFSTPPRISMCLQGPQFRDLHGE